MKEEDSRTKETRFPTPENTKELFDDEKGDQRKKKVCGHSDCSENAVLTQQNLKKRKNQTMRSKKETAH